MRFDTKELFQRLPREPVTRQNEIWSVELFRHDGRERVSILLALDVFSGLPMVLDLTSGKARQVASKLEEACRSGYPKTLWLDQSFELKSRDLKKWAEHRGIVIQYGVPYQKAMTARPLP
jgi:putative transposase